MKMSQAIRSSKTLLNEYKGYIDAIYKLDSDEINSTAGLYQEIKNNLIDTGYFTAKEMIELIGNACNEGFHYRHGYIELMKRILEEYFADNINISLFSKYDDIKINTPEYAIMNDNEEELLYHLKSKRFDLTKILEKCCLRGAINCFKLIRKEFNVKITKKCLDASFRGNNQHIIKECLKEKKPDDDTMEAAIASHNFDNVEKLNTEYELQISSYPCTTYLNLYAYILFLDYATLYDLSFGLFKS